MFKYIIRNAGVNQYYKGAPGCFAAGRATTGFAIASAASFASLSPVAGFAAFRIPSLKYSYIETSALPTVR